MGPYVIQEVLENPEFGSYAIYNKGELTGFEFFESAASCLVYRQVQGKQYDQVMELHRGLGKAMNLTGQLTLDLMHTSSGDLVPIECNPRIHSAVCTLEGHKNLGAVFTDPDYAPKKKSDVATSRPETYRYWVMDQLFLMAGFWKAKNCFKLTFSQMLTGSDALLHGDDPMPFLAMYLIQIPSLLTLELLSGKHWLKIDFCFCTCFPLRCRFPLYDVFRITPGSRCYQLFSSLVFSLGHSTYSLCECPWGKMSHLGVSTFSTWEGL